MLSAINCRVFFLDSWCTTINVIDWKKFTDTKGTKVSWNLNYYSFPIIAFQERVSG
jgi:hypothetical protein